MKQLTFDIKAHRLCHRGDPDTSREAAQKMVKSGKAEVQRQQVLNSIRDMYKECYFYDGFTAKELANYCATKKEYNHLTYYLIQRRKHEIPEIEEVFDRQREGCAVWRLKK